MLAPNDCLDTADDDWEQKGIAACRDHVNVQIHTSKRIKHKKMNRFVKFGGATPCEIFGYTKPPGARTYDDWAKDEAAAQGKELDVYTVGVVTCRPTQKEAEEYYHYATIENGDWSAVDGILGKKKISPATVGEEEFQRQRHHYAHGMGGLLMVGDPDRIAQASQSLDSVI